MTHSDRVALERLIEEAKVTDQAETLLAVITNGGSNFKRKGLETGPRSLSLLSARAEAWVAGGPCCGAIHTSWFTGTARQEGPRGTLRGELVRLMFSVVCDGAGYGEGGGSNQCYCR